MLDTDHFVPTAHSRHAIIAEMIANTGTMPCPIWLDRIPFDRASVDGRRLPCWTTVLYKIDGSAACFSGPSSRICHFGLSAAKYINHLGNCDVPYTRYSSCAACTAFNRALFVSVLLANRTAKVSYVNRFKHPMSESK